MPRFQLVGMSDYSANAASGHYAGVRSSWNRKSESIHRLHRAATQADSAAAVVLEIRDGATLAAIRIPGLREPAVVYNGRDADMLAQAIARRLRVRYIVRDVK